MPLPDDALQTEAEFEAWVSEYQHWYSSLAGVVEREANIALAATVSGLTVEEWTRRVNANFKPWIK